MTNCIFYTLIFTLFMSVSFGSLRFSQVHRAFLSVYKGLLEAAVITVGNDGEPLVPYYDVDLINSNVRSFLVNNIEKYVSNYTLSINFLNEKDGFECVEECRYISITLNADINFLYHYEKTQAFSILSKDTI